MKKALITGITGQDGAYLAEFLLGKEGYEVHGIKRRASSFNTGRVDHLYREPHEEGVRFFMHYGDLTDSTNLIRIIQMVQPDEIYNLAAQSHVKVSFETPEYTANSDAIGTLRLLEAIRILGLEKKSRFYQASTSEMYGKVQEIPQKETTPFYPRSPYGAAKVYAYWITVNYREAYNMFACNGILFNHECVTAETPVFIRKDGLIDLLPIEDIVPHQTDARRCTTELSPENRFEVWDAKGWTEITCMTATSNRDKEKIVNRIAAKGAVFHASSDHIAFVEHDGKYAEKAAGDIQAGESLFLIALPQPVNRTIMTEAEAWLLGILAAQGHISKEGEICITNPDSALPDSALIDRVAEVWRKVSGGSHSCESLGELKLSGNDAYARYFYDSLYTQSGCKRIPKQILNSGYQERTAFLTGFNEVSQRVETSSAVLAAGIYWMTLTTLKQKAVIFAEDRGGKLYYRINLDSSDEESNTEQQKVVEARPIEYKDWLFDLATNSGTFHAGVGQGWIHNSPIRGETFVTRKITRAVARIKLGLQDRINLGNLDSQRDWGFARDYVRAMWLMLQQNEPDDYVVATGEAHSVREFVEKAFREVGIQIAWEGTGVDEVGKDSATGKIFVRIEPRYFRPTEVEFLLGDPTKAKEKLGWKPKISFDNLVKIMVEEDIKEAERDHLCRREGFPTYNQFE